MKSCLFSRQSNIGSFSWILTAASRDSITPAHREAICTISLLLEQKGTVQHGTRWGLELFRSTREPQDSRTDEQHAESLQEGSPMLPALSELIWDCRPAALLLLSQSPQWSPGCTHEWFTSSPGAGWAIFSHQIIWKLMKCRIISCQTIMVLQCSSPTWGRYKTNISSSCLF